MRGKKNNPDRQYNPNWGGPRPNSGGPRPNSGGKREGAGRKPVGDKPLTILYNQRVTPAQHAKLHRLFPTAHDFRTFVDSLPDPLHPDAR